MKKIAVVTDSNSGITQRQAEEYGVYVVPMPFIMDGTSYFEDINLSQETFYQKLQEDLDISTSQPSTGSLMELWDRLLKEYEEIVHIPMSSGLSASYGSAAALSQEYGQRIQVVNNQRISVTQRQSALDALKLADSGRNAAEIKEYLESVKFETGIYVMVDTLKYLKKGGRITPAAAAIGSILNIKPVLQIHGDKLDSYAKARGTKQARKIMIKAVQSDFANRFPQCSDPEHMWLQMAYSYNKEAAYEFKAEVEKEFTGYEIIVNPLSLSVSCHTGPGALALAYSKKIDVK